MKLIVTDTNIFFDIIKIGALPEFFSMEYEICTTYFVIKEILLSDQRYQIESFIRAKSLTVFELNEKEIEIVKSFKTKRSFKGITDKSVLWKATELSCPLLTGDRKLRCEAEDLGIEVHGSPWIIKTLVENGLIEKEKGIQLLEFLKEINISMPIEKIDDLIKYIKK